MLALAATALLAAAPSTAVGIGLDEFTLAAYRAKVPQGTVRFNVTNRGEDPHDLAVRTAKGKVVAQMPRLAAGERGRLKVVLRTRGTYTLFCTIAGHEGLGMKARLRVVRR